MQKVQDPDTLAILFFWKFLALLTEHLPFLFAQHKGSPTATRSAAANPPPAIPLASRLSGMSYHTKREDPVVITVSSSHKHGMVLMTARARRGVVLLNKWEL
jgi:hypothetical protein